MAMILQGETVEAGEAQGQLLVSSDPLSFWGGYDYHTGTIIDRRHPLAGQCAAGQILALPYTRGSSSTTAVLLEAVKAGTAPAAIITTQPDAFFALASIVADELYGLPIPLVALPEGDFSRLKHGATACIRESGRIEIDHER